MIDNQTTRRRFLVAAITLSSCASGAVGPSILRIGSAWAESPGDVDDKTMEAMVRMARLLFPHDAMPEEVYASVLDSALSAAAGDGSFAGVLNAAEQALNTARQADWVDLDENEQIAVLQELQGEGFFAAIQGTVRAGIYFHPVFWEHIGYPGSSKEFGGYINRGSDDIDWLPGDP